MKESDLHREYARIIDMCEGTGLPVKECVKLRGQIVDLDVKPRFDDRPDDYSFAVAILEGKPLFVGDEVYWKSAGSEFDWDKGLFPDAEDYQEALTRTPARTITLNGEKLPAPEGSSGFALYIAGAGTARYIFQSSKARDSVENAIYKLLKGD